MKQGPWWVKPETSGCSASVGPWGEGHKEAPRNVDQGRVAVTHDMLKTQGKHTHKHAQAFQNILWISLPVTQPLSHGFRPQVLSLSPRSPSEGTGRVGAPGCRVSARGRGGPGMGRWLECGQLPGGSGSQVTGPGTAGTGGHGKAGHHVS